LPNYRQFKPLFQFPGAAAPDLEVRELKSRPRGSGSSRWAELETKGSGLQQVPIVPSISFEKYLNRKSELIKEKF
jgi:hypothetical protein